MGWLSDLFRRRRPSPAPPPIPTPPPNAGDIVLLLAQHNLERSARGLPALVLSQPLIATAQRHAEWMHRTSTLSHTGEGGSNLIRRLGREGYSFSAGGENIAYGYTTVPAVMTGWMSSYGHRTNILGRAYTEVGFGRSGLYWCAVLAHPYDRASSVEVSDGRQIGLWLPEPLLNDRPAWTPPGED